MNALIIEYLSFKLNVQRKTFAEIEDATINLNFQNSFFINFFFLFKHLKVIINNKIK